MNPALTESTMVTSSNGYIAPVNRLHRLALVLIVAFAAKALVLGQIAFNRWDYPDEIHHFGYVYELVSGKGFPVLGTTRIDKAIGKDMGVEEEAARTLTSAQHSPLYYLLMVPPYLLGEHLNGLAGAVSAMRILSTVLFAAGFGCSMSRWLLLPDR